MYVQISISMHVESPIGKNNKMMPNMLIFWTKWLTFLNSPCGNSIISKKYVSHNLDANKFVVQLDLKFQIMLIVVENNVDFLLF